MKRLLTSFLLIPTISWVILWAPDPVLVVAVCLFATICWIEYTGIAAHYGAKFKASAGYLPGLAFLLLQRLETPYLIVLGLASLVFSMACKDLRDAAPSAALYMLGILYVFGAWRSAIALHAANEYWLFFALTINWVGDSAAYYVGRSFGKHKLAPRVSPAKSWEGAIASGLTAGLWGIFFLRWAIPEVSLPAAAALAMAGNAAGQFGDLAESALKRGAGVKDSGTTLPGHGGWLDRLDSSLFSMPIVHALLLVSGMM
jgi:phosphatidate cytidylyltransferase